MKFLASYIALWIFVGFLGLVAIALLRELADLKATSRTLHLTSPPLAIGSAAPAFTGVDLRTNELLSTEHPREKGCVLLFVSPNCSICRKLVRSAESKETLFSELLIICRGERSACLSVFGHPEPIGTVSDEDGSIGAFYGVRSSPVAITIDSHGLIRGYNYPNNLTELKDVLSRSRVLRQAPQAQ